MSVLDSAGTTPNKPHRFPTVHTDFSLVPPTYMPQQYYKSERAGPTLTLAGLKVCVQCLLSNLHFSTPAETLCFFQPSQTSLSSCSDLLVLSSFYQACFSLEHCALPMIVHIDKYLVHLDPFSKSWFLPSNIEVIHFVSSSTLFIVCYRSYVVQQYRFHLQNMFLTTFFLLARFIIIIYKILFIFNFPCQPKITLPNQRSEHTMQLCEHHISSHPLRW